MRTITQDTRAVAEYLRKEFGAVAECRRRGCGFVAPPIGVKFEVLEPLQTEPSTIEEKRNTEYGLTHDSCIPPGIYDGLTEPGILAGTSTHAVFINGSEEHGTNRVCLRAATGNIDWRGVRAVKD